MSLVNGNFETWGAGLPTGWTVTTGGTSTVTQETTIVHGGTSSAKFFVDAGGDPAEVAQNASAVVGTSYSGGIWFNVPSPKSPYIRITLVGGASDSFWLQVDGSWAVGVNQFTPVGSDAWAQWVMPTTNPIPTGVTSVHYAIGRNDGNVTWYVDDASFDAVTSSTHGLGLLGVGA